MENQTITQKILGIPSIIAANITAPVVVTALITGIAAPLVLHWMQKASEEKAIEKQMALAEREREKEIRDKLFTIINDYDFTENRAKQLQLLAKFVSENQKLYGEISLSSLATLAEQSITEATTKTVEAQKRIEEAETTMGEQKQEIDSLNTQLKSLQSELASTLLTAAEKVKLEEQQQATLKLIEKLESDYDKTIIELTEARIRADQAKEQAENANINLESVTKELKDAQDSASRYRSMNEEFRTFIGEELSKSKPRWVYTGDPDKREVILQGTSRISIGENDLFKFEAAKLDTAATVDVYLRTAPSTFAIAETVIPKGKKVRVVGFLKFRTDDFVWAKVVPFDDGDYYD